MAVLTVLLQMPEILDSTGPVLLPLIDSPFVKTIWILPDLQPGKGLFPSAGRPPRKSSIPVQP